MQSVIELGRVLRDRKTMPVKYPLPELIVIHTDQECLDDVKSLEVIFFFSYFFLATNCMVVTRHAGKTGDRRGKIVISGQFLLYRHKALYLVAPPIFSIYSNPPVTVFTSNFSDLLPTLSEVLEMLQPCVGLKFSVKKLSF